MLELHDTSSEQYVLSGDGMARSCAGFVSRLRNSVRTRRGDFSGIGRPRPLAAPTFRDRRRRKPQFCEPIERIVDALVQRRQRPLRRRAAGCLSGGRGVRGEASRSALF